MPVLDKFVVSPPLLASTVPLYALKLCDARLQADARWPWIVLVPRRVGARELEHLSPPDRAQLMEEIILAGSAVRAAGAALGRPVDKLNVATLGNITPQLHVHVLGRRSDDAAWPQPVWGAGEPAPYGEAALKAAVSAATDILASVRAAS